MLRRGSAQLLLLFFRSRPRLGWLMAGTAFILMLATLARAGGEFPIMKRTGLAELLRQTAWEHALATLPEQAPWPWAETSAGVNGSVSQLGLSAVIKDNEASAGEGSAVGPIRRAAAQDPHLPPSDADGAGIGEHITVTTADGATWVYRVPGRNVIDPHLADVQQGDVESSLATCLPLVLQTKKAEPSTQSEPGPEHKL